LKTEKSTSPKSFVSSALAISNGRVKKKVVPSPATEVKDISPPRTSTRCLQIESPSPVPPG